jgi:hypothetical protein
MPFQFIEKDREMESSSSRSSDNHHHHHETEEEIALYVAREALHHFKCRDCGISRMDRLMKETLCQTCGEEYPVCAFCLDVRTVKNVFEGWYCCKECTSPENIKPCTQCRGWNWKRAKREICDECQGYEVTICEECDPTPPNPRICCSNGSVLYHRSKEKEEFFKESKGLNCLDCENTSRERREQEERKNEINKFMANRPAVGSQTSSSSSSSSSKKRKRRDQQRRAALMKPEMHFKRVKI